MKRLLSYILKLWIIFVLACSSVVAYVITDWDHNEIIKQLQKETITATIEINKVLEKNDKEEIKEQEDKNVVTSTKQVVNNIYQKEDYTPANTISIANGFSKPLMKDYDGSHFYLNHNINGVYDGVGVPFVDYRTNFYGRKTIIYAHSSPNGNGPFQGLQNYHNNYSYYQGHRYINVTYNGVNYTYEIFSVYVALATNEYSEILEYFYGMNYSDNEWQQTLDEYKRNSQYETGVSVNSNDKILILQTCSMDPSYSGYLYANLLVMAKLV